MDDLYEYPKEEPPRIPNIEAEEDGESSGEEDGPDWTKLPTPAGLVRPIIPRRGEKEFEPATGGPTSLQEYSLDRARGAMVDALKGVRGISSKTVTYALWLPGIARSQVVQARGVHFSSLGYSARRTTSEGSNDDEKKSKTTTRLELLPEETLYLVERGSLLCYKQENDSDHIDWVKADGGTPVGTPITVQQAFAEMIGKEDMTLERYECYAYLKRLGFVVTRAIPPAATPSYPLPPPHRLGPPPRHSSSVIQVLRSLWSWATGRLKGPKDKNWLTPLLQPLRWWSTCDYPSIFRGLRIIPAGHSVPPRSSTKDNKISPYQVFFHIWKPNTPWKKTSIPAPDFELVVVNGRTTPLPSLEELTVLFAALPTIPPPLPRRRNGMHKLRPVAAVSLRTILNLSWFLDRWRGPGPVTPTPHPFAAIRAGHKNVIIGVVDAGTISFMRFGEGCFEEWPMV